MPFLCFHGTVIDTSSPLDLRIRSDTLLVVDEHGIISLLISGVPKTHVSQSLQSKGFTALSIQYLGKYEFLLPGFVDTHNHAPQFAQRGLGQGLHILDWLNQLTFPNEAKFKDISYARKVYGRAVDAFLRQGITCASYYGSLHGPSTKTLADVCLAKGQRALVGKCNMNRNSPAYYVESNSQESLDATMDVINHIRELDKGRSLLFPILTPRFAISCDAELLSGLGRLATDDHTLPIQTHFNEAQQEIDATLQLFPNFTNETDLYEHFGLLTNRTILAHCTIMQDFEFPRLKALGCGIAHCPIANTTVGGGFMAAPIRKFLEQGTKVGLGTDSGGGFSSSMLDVIRQALIVSNAREVMDGSKGLSLTELFHMATLGGAQVCGLGDLVGSFEVGKHFDALVVKGFQTLDGEDDTSVEGVMTVIEEDDTMETVLEKFLLTGDDRNIKEVYVDGKLVQDKVASGKLQR